MKIQNISQTRANLQKITSFLNLAPQFTPKLLSPYTSVCQKFFGGRCSNQFFMHEVSDSGEVITDSGNAHCFDLLVLASA